MHRSTATTSDQDAAPDDPVVPTPDTDCSPVDPPSFPLGRFPFELREKVIEDAAVAAYPDYSDDDPYCAKDEPFREYSLLLVNKQFHKVVTPYRWWVRDLVERFLACSVY